jgi:hypothetical protein
VKIEIRYNAPYAAELDFEYGMKKMNYKYFDDVNELMAWLKSVNDMVWRAKIDNFVKWLKDYKGVVDLGYIVLIDGEKIERIINIHIHYSVWLERPAVRFAEIAEFTSEDFEDDD